MNIHHAAQALGGEVNGPGQILCPGPGHSPSDRSLSVRFSGDDFTVNSFAGDDWRSCKDYVRACLGLDKWEPGDGRDRRIQTGVRDWDRRTVDAEAADSRRTEDDLIRIRRAQELWNDARRPQGTLVERYLRQHRRLNLPGELCGTVLRFHPRCPWRNEDTGRTEFLPAMLAAFRSIDDGAITAVHRIALKPDGSKIGRRMLGVVHRAAVMLDAATDAIGIGEGVETCMAVRQMGIGLPVWALGSVGSISFFPVLDGIERLHIIGEAGDASRQAMDLCGQRWKRAGRRVFLRKPGEGYSDFNDVLMAGGSR